MEASKRSAQHGARRRAALPLGSPAGYCDASAPPTLAAPFLRATYTQVAMSHSLPLPPPGFDELPADEKLDYLQSLWGRMAAHPDQVPIPEWHRAVIEERLEEHRAHPDDVAPWDEVRDSVTNKLRRDRE